MGFHRHLQAAWEHSGSMLCVGLDPDPTRFPEVVNGSVFDFCREIVDATADLVCAFKPQIAYFAATGAEADLEHLCVYIRDCHPHALLVLDAKRGDIGSTAEQYAAEAFDRYGAHVVTVNPYLGGDSVEPFLRHPEGGVFVLCRTSNPGSGDFQSLPVDGRPLYQHVAQRVAEQWQQIGDCGLVVGATYPQELAEVRALVGDLPLLVPGVGAQGGDIPATVAAGLDSSEYGMVVNSSRAILYASSGPDFAAAARAEAERTRDALCAGRG
ncbi:MAG TPA: orotidine-5'-phosphate decarboxylase [Ilumatobacteraceae bacterium]|nr:orotidine-5'-phosphate decarboxylase [Ilumatobacteraceae bacterium]